MEALFLKILSLSLGATYVAAAVIALRFLLKRTPKWIVCAMWGLVAIRLLCPFTLESAVSLAPSPDFRPVPLISANQPEAPAQTPRPSAAQDVYKRQVFGPKGLAVRQLKRHASWVQNVVRQFGPYLLRA